VLGDTLDHSQQISYPSMFFLQQLHVYQNKFEDGIETWLEKSFRENIHVNNNVFILLMMDRMFSNMIILFIYATLIQFLLMTFYVHMIASLELHESNKGITWMKRKEDEI